MSELRVRGGGGRGEEQDYRGLEQSDKLGKHSALDEREKVVPFRRDVHQSKSSLLHQLRTKYPVYEDEPR
jgi:hypothetical protein